MGMQKICNGVALSFFVFYSGGRQTKSDDTAIWYYFMDDARTFSVKLFNLFILLLLES